MKNPLRRVLVFVLALVLGLFAIVALPEEAHAATAKFTLSGQTAPSALIKGSSFTLKGTISSANPLKKVEVGVVNKSTGKWVSGSYKATQVTAKTFNIASVDSAIKFGSLPNGDYYYRIWAHDNTGAVKKVLDQPFTVASASKLTLSRQSSPGNLKKGSSFVVKGKVTSTFPLKKVDVGVVNKSTGKWVSGAYKSTATTVKTFDLATADSAIKFGSLSAGTYYYRVTASDASGASKQLLNKEFTVSANGTTNANAKTTSASNFAVSGQTLPTALIKGSSFTLKGKLTSANPLKKVEVGVVNKSTGKWVSSSYKAMQTTAKTFNIASVDSAIKFGSLPNGDYYYRIWAQDSKGTTKKVLDQPFTVASASKITVTGQTYPTSLKTGGSFTIKGKVISAFPLKKVDVGVVNKSTGKWVSGAYKSTATTAKMFDISTVDSAVKFGSLSAGTYYYRVTATDAKGTTKQLVNQTFTVAAPTKTTSSAQQTTGSVTANANGVLLRYPGGVISSIGAQPYSGPCGIYAMAYVRAILDNGFTLPGSVSYQERIITQYGLGTSYAYWYRAGGTMINFSTAKSMYRAAIQQLNKGRPCIINCYNPTTGNNHFLCVIGYVKGTTSENVSLASFIVLDPATGTKRNVSATNYQTPEKSYYGPELIIF